jgi:predicted ATPase
MGERLLERDAPLGVLAGAVADAAAGRGSTVVISGEAGIGKTSLVRAFATDARGDARLLAGACDDLMASRTLGPLHDAAIGTDGPLAAALADDVVVPAAATCCGFAGDRGLLHPDLTEAATRDEAAELRARPADVYVSSNRTCELGLRLATGAPYRSVLLVLEELTRDGDVSVR